MKRGFTLFELLIFVAIFATISAFLFGFLWIVVLGNIKETAFEEVQQNGRFVISKITQEIKKATGINFPLPGNSVSSLSFSMADANLNPTIFDLLNGKLRITQGISPPVELTSDQVQVSTLQFTNLSYGNTPGTIRIEISLDHFNPGNRAEYQASVNFTSSVSLVPGGAAPSGPEIKKPTAHDDPTVWTNSAQAYNFPDTPNDQSDAGSDTSMPDRLPPNFAILFQNWDLKGPTPYTSTTLKVNWRTNGSHSNDRFAVQYTINGGGNWSDLIPLAVHNETTIQTSLANLNSNQDLTQVQVRVISDRQGGADGGTLFIYDIWTEGSF